MSVVLGLIEESAAFIFCTFLMNCFGKRVKDNRELEREKEKHYVTVSSILVSLKDANMESEAGLSILEL